MLIVSLPAPVLMRSVPAPAVTLSAAEPVSMVLPPVTAVAVTAPSAPAAEMFSKPE
jgi:hypothetical protein